MFVAVACDSGGVFWCSRGRVEDVADWDGGVDMSDWSLEYVGD